MGVGGGAAAAGSDRFSAFCSLVSQFPLKQEGSYVFRVTGEKVGASRTLAYSYPDEYHLHEPNVDLLRAISDETKGKFQPAALDIFATNGETTILAMPLWPYLAMIALVLYFADIFLRRVRFEP